VHHQPYAAIPFYIDAANTNIVDTHANGIIVTDNAAISIV
jgi:hypothetical protein